MKTDPVEASERDRAMAAARGDAPFDVLLTGGTVVDVATCELRPADVGLVGCLIASVHPAGQRDDAAEIVDVTGQYLAPGFMDLHVHFESSMLTPGAYAAAVVPHGTTTVFADPHELGNAAGLAGVRYAVEASRGLPLRYVIQAPSCVPPVPGLELSSADFAGEEVETMLGWPEVGGVAEVMDMLGVLDRDGRMVDVVGAGIEAGKLVSGHAFQLTGPALQAYLCAGITSDHENVLPDEVLEKLRAGMTVELRYLIETLLPPVVEQLNALPTMPTNLVLCSDDIFACDLVEVGHIDEGLRRLIAAGLDPVQAIRLATINGAYRLQRTDLGLVGPGRRADIVVLSDLEQVTVADVWVDGRRVASGGRMLEDVTEGPASPPLDTVALAPFAPEDFVVELDVADGPAAVRTIHMPVFTSWGEATVEVSDGVAIIPDDLLVQASVHRYGRAPGVPSLALLSGWGAWTGAIATTVSHDTHNLQVFGRDPADMALAANTVIATGGGVAVVQDGVVLSSIALPVAGILSDRPVDEVVAAQHEVNAAALTIGEFTPFLPWPIFQTFATSLACLPGPHNTDVGLTDGSTGEIVASILLEPAV